MQFVDLLCLSIKIARTWQGEKLLFFLFGFERSEKSVFKMYTFLIQDQVSFRLRLLILSFIELQ